MQRKNSYQLAFILILSIFVLLNLLPAFGDNNETKAEKYFKCTD